MSVLKLPSFLAYSIITFLPYFNLAKDGHLRSRRRISSFRWILSCFGSSDLIDMNRRLPDPLPSTIQIPRPQTRDSCVLL